MARRAQTLSVRAREADEAASASAFAAAATPTRWRHHLRCAVVEGRRARQAALEIRSRHDEEVKLRVIFVHGACVKDGSWWWHRTGALLAERGVASEAPALPSCGETGVPAGAQGPGLAEDVASVRKALTASDEQTIVVAHSYSDSITAEPRACSRGRSRRPRS